MTRFFERLTSQTSLKVDLMRLCMTRYSKGLPHAWQDTYSKGFYLMNDKILKRLLFHEWQNNLQCFLPQVWQDAWTLYVFCSSVKIDDSTPVILIVAVLSGIVTSSFLNLSITVEFFKQNNLSTLLFIVFLLHIIHNMELTYLWLQLSH